MVPLMTIPTSSGSKCLLISATTCGHTTGYGNGMGINSKVLLHFITAATTAMAAGGSTSTNLLVHTHVLAYQTAKL